MKKLIISALLVAFSANAFAGELDFGFNKNFSSFPSTQAGSKSYSGFNLGYQEHFGKFGVFADMKDGKHANVEEGGVFYKMKLVRGLTFEPDIYAGRLRVGDGKGNLGEVDPYQNSGGGSSGSIPAHLLLGFQPGLPDPVSSPIYPASTSLMQRYNAAYADFAGIGGKLTRRINSRVAVYADAGIGGAFDGKIAGMKASGIEYQTGVGASYALNSAWALDASYSMYGLEIGGHSATSNNLGIGVSYRW